MNKKYYLSLCRGLVGYYVLFEATSEEVVRKHAAEYFGRLWCSVYTQEAIDVQRGCGFTIRVINEDKPIILDDCPDWE